MKPVFKRIYEQFRANLTAPTRTFDREVIAQLQNTMDRLHAENVQLRAESDAIYLKLAQTNRKLSLIADIVMTDSVPVIVLPKPKETEISE
jgi:hypothetical protein